MPITTELSDLVRAAGAPDATQATTDALRSRRGELAAIHGDDDLRTHLPWLDVEDPASVGTLMRALAIASPEDARDPDPEARSVICDLRDEDHRRIGRWWAGATATNLAGTPTLARALEGTPVMDPDALAFLSAEPSVAAGGAAAAEVARHGVTPVHVVEACAALGNLVRRALRATPEATHALLWADMAPEGVLPVPRAVGQREVELYAELPPDVAGRIADWILTAAAREPLLIRGCRASPTDAGLSLARTDERMAWEPDGAEQFVP